MVAVGRQQVVGEERQAERAHSMAEEEVLLMKVSLILWVEVEVELLQHLVVVEELEGENRN